MARIRMLKPSFFTDERVVSVSAFARLLFIGLWCEADREGRLEDRPLGLKMRLFPADAVDIGALLDELCRAQLVERYRVGDVAVISIPRFTKHQHVHFREARSTLPPKPSSPGKPGLKPHASTRSPGKPGQRGVAKGGQPVESESESESDPKDKEADTRGTASGPPAFSLKSEPPQNARTPALALVPKAPQRSKTANAALWSALEAEFERATGVAYKHGGAKDARALKRLAAHSSAAEIVARFRRALATRGWPSVRTVAQLDARWNDIPAQPATPPRVTDRRVCEACREAPAPFEAWGHRLCAACHAEVSRLLDGNQAPDTLAATTQTWVQEHAKVASR